MGPDKREVVTGLFYTTLCDPGLSQGCRLRVGGRSIDVTGTRG